MPARTQVLRPAWTLRLKANMTAPGSGPRNSEVGSKQKKRRIRFSNLGKKHKNKMKWREVCRHGEGRRRKEKKKKVQIQKKIFDHSITYLKVRQYILYKSV
jgi:hypothetical protein